MKLKKAEDRRLGIRKFVDKIEISDFTSLSNYRLVAKAGCIIDASISGILLRIERKELVPDDLKMNLSLDSLVGQQVLFFLPQMNLDLDGVVNRAVHKGKGHFELAIEFSSEVPQYWRECLIDLLPEPGEMNKVENG